MDYGFLSKTLLFRGISPKEIEDMLPCLKAVTKSYSKGETIYHAGDTITAIGMVLSGNVSIETDDVWGNKSILAKVSSGNVFAEAYACLPGVPLMINAVASDKCEILFLDINHILNVCGHNCQYHTRLIRNMLTVASQKNMNLSHRIFHTSAKSIRGRLLSFLSFQATRHGSSEFTIPFNRQQLSDYLSVDRSALSAELSKMQRDGLIKVDRSHFILLTKE